MSGSACPACGASAAEGARYCRLCGAALGLADHGPGPSIGPAATGSIHHDAPSRWWLAGAALLVVLGVGWVAVRSVGRDPATDSAAPSTTADSTPDSTPDSTADTAAESTESSTAESGSADASSGVRVVEEGSGPVLGRAVGWSVLVGDPYSGGGLWRLDLDSGRLLRYPKVAGGPLAVAGDRLLLMDTDLEDGTGALSAVPLDDPSRQPPVPVAGPANVGPFTAPAVGPAEGDGGGAVWIFDYGPGTARWVLVSLTTGEMIDEVVVGTAFSSGAVWGAGPELATSGNGGLFRRDGDDYRLVVPGRTVVAVGGDVLIQTCSSPSDCRMSWVDSDAGQAVDRPIPPLDDDSLWWQGLVPGSDRFVSGRRAERAIEEPQVVLFDLVTSRLIDLGSTAGRGVVASPDGRFLFTSGFGDTSELQMAIYDVEAGESYPLAGSPPVANAQAVFVPNG